MFKKKRCIILTDMEYRSLVRIMVDCRNKFLGIKSLTHRNTECGGNYGKIHIQRKERIALRIDR